MQKPAREHACLCRGTRNNHTPYVSPLNDEAFVYTHFECGVITTCCLIAACSSGRPTLRASITLPGLM